MIARLARIAIALLLPVALASCVLAPGKFVSTLVINKDRTFSFSYVGEVIAIDMADQMGRGMGDGFGKAPLDGGDLGGGGGDDGTGDGAGDGNGADESKPAFFQQLAGHRAVKDKKKPQAQPTPQAQADAEKAAATDAKNRAIAAALSKEAGYRKVTYEGNGKFLIDYAIAGTLTYNFVYPYNLDAEIVLPFVVVELRQGNTIRVKAPAFGDEGAAKNAPGADKVSSMLDGVFTLDTDAEIVSQNNEDGAATGPGGRKVIAWKATPLSKAAPMAVLRLAR